MAATPKVSTQQDPWKTLSIECKGGLNTSTDTLSYQPGEAWQLVNYEPGIYGGYRRINGYAKFDTSTVTGTGSVLGVAVWNGNSAGVIACRGPNVMFSSGSGWSSITNARTSASRYTFWKYFYGGGRKIAMCDGVNQAATWDGTTYTLINGTGAPANPKYVTFFKGCLVLAGFTSNPAAFILSAPSSDTDFNAADGALTFDVHDKITGIRNFREILYIFCERSIYQLTGNTSADFAIAPIATRIGTMFFDSIQEVNGDLVYLAEDGIRTLSGTMKLNDVELGTLSKPILNTAISIDRSIANDPNNVISTIVREKNQYRLFYNTSGQANGDALGIIGAIRPGKQMMTQFGTYISVWEWATTLGIRPRCADSDIIQTAETVVMGMDDGFVYQMENGNNSFGGTNITSSYLTAPLQLDDPEIRKLLQKITVYLHIEGLAQIVVTPVYDFSDSNTLQPFVSTVLPVVDVVSLYGKAHYGTDKYGGTLQPKVYTNLSGSGKIVQLLFQTNDMNPSHSIQGISLQYKLLGRR